VVNLQLVDFVSRPDQRGLASLSSTGFCKTPYSYFAYGAACSEVMIDTLTDEMEVQRVDILHDFGRSLNPSIDLGRIEGGFMLRRPTKSLARSLAPPTCQLISTWRCSTA